jgi:hypothetical protein
MSLLEQARAERDRLNKVIELLEGSEKPTRTAATPKRVAGKSSPASKAYWTPQRRAEMSRRIKALNAKKKGASAKKA